MAQVLIVDDDRDLAKGLADIIEMHGHEATIASNGKEAVERFRERDFDIAFIDVRMPVMNGVDSFLEIRKLHPCRRSSTCSDSIGSRSRGTGQTMLHRPHRARLIARAATEPGQKNVP
jgi:CheY-like chemotaxis protein